MSTLSDRDIRRNVDSGRIGLLGPDAEPLPLDAEAWRLQPASVELTLAGGDRTLLGYGRDLIEYDARSGRPVSNAIVDPELPPRMTERSWWTQETTGRRYYVLQPGEFLLGCIAETVRVDSSLCAKVEGKSSLGRLGLFVHVSAGFVDPGWEGRVTLELYNAAPRALKVWEGMRIAQVRFEWLSSASQRPYGSDGLGSHYQGSLNTVQSAINKSEPPVTEAEVHFENSNVPKWKGAIPVGTDRFA